MLQLIRPTAVSLILALGFAAPSFANPSPTQQFGYPLAKPSREPSLACYMKTDSGRLINLDEFCVTGGQEPELGTGDIQATLRWETVDDLDLAVTDPSGQTVFYRNPRVRSGGQQDVDANADCIEPVARPVENIFWLPGGAPAGKYTVEARLYRRCAPSGPVPFNLTVLVQGETKELTGSVDDRKPAVRFPFAVTR
ncbi:MAG: hypothetical protein KME12_02620 [Trichocoleus desertorum ATA4-8-CV12]|jgi:hypothetical protein|nr:hypothetical protein [Trichocoleus desertorum ATA4-8-CV12]